MRQPRLALAAALLGASLFAAGVAIGRRPAPGQVGQQPTEHHQRLLRDVGTWDGQFMMFMPGATEPLEGTVTETVRSIGGFWTHSVMRGDVMGMPLEGVYLHGYDPERGKYVGCWIDNMGPQWELHEGFWDAENGVLRMEYEGPDMLGRVAKQWNTVDYDAEGKRMFQSFVQQQDGSSVMWMEVVSTKRPAAGGGR